MKFLLFFVLLLNRSLTVISVTGFNDKFILQPVSSPSLVLRKVALPPSIRIPTEQSRPNVVFLRPVLFQVEFLKKISGRGHLKNRPGRIRPESSIPRPEGPAYKIVSKSQGNNYNKIPDPYRPNTRLENRRKYFRGDVRVIPLPYRSIKNGYHLYKPDVSRERNRFIKNSSPYSSLGDNASEIEKAKRKWMIPPFYNTKRRITATRNPTEGSVYNRFPAKITDERGIPLNDLITDKSGISIQDNDNLPITVNYGDAKIFSKFPHQSDRMKMTTALHPQYASSSNFKFESKPRPNHSYEVEEIIEENVRLDLGEKKKEKHMRRKPAGGRQFKFDKNAYEGFTVVVPSMTTPDKNNEVIQNSINTILNTLINPMKIIPKTESPIQDKDNLPMAVSYGDAKTFPKVFHQSNRMKTNTASYPESISSGNFSLNLKPRLNDSHEVGEIVEENTRFDLEEKKEEKHMTRKPAGGRQFKFDENAHEGFTTPVASNKMKPTKDEVIENSITTVLNNLINQVKFIPETETPTQDNDNLPMTVSYSDAKISSKFARQSDRMTTTTASYTESTSLSHLLLDLKPQLNDSHEVKEIIEENIRFDLEEEKEDQNMTRKPAGGRQFKFDENAPEVFTTLVSNKMKPAKNEVVDSAINTVLNSLINPETTVAETEEKSPDSNKTIITLSPPTLQNSFTQPRTENFPRLSTLPPHSSVEFLLRQTDKPQNEYATNTEYVSIPPNPHNNYFTFFGALTTETAQPEENTEFPSQQSVPSQNFQNWDPYSTSTRIYDNLLLQQFSPKESQRNINSENLVEMKYKTDNDFSTLFPTVKPNALFLPEVFNLVEGFSEADRILSTPNAAFSEEDKMTSTISPIHYDQALNVFTTNPPKSTQEDLFSPALQEVNNNLDFLSFESFTEPEEEKIVQQLFTSAPLQEFTVLDQNTETEPSERDKKTSTQSEFFEIGTEFDLLDSESKPRTETDQSFLTPAKPSDDQHSISESVDFGNLFTTTFYTGNKITGLSHSEVEESTSPSPPLTWMAVSKNDIKSTTERNYFEEDEDAKTTTSKEFTDVSVTVDLLNTTMKDSAQESNWKSDEEMDFNQNPAKIILDNQITHNTEKGQRSDIPINDTLEDSGENQNQISSLNYMESLKEKSAHLSAGSLIKIAPESIIPLIPKVINDLRDDRLSDENLKVLSHAYGKYWSHIQALSKNANLDILPLIKMKDEKDLESILTSFVLEEPTTTTVKRKNDENPFEYDYLGDYNDMYDDILNHELGPERKKKIRIKRDEEDDLKTVEANREYFDSIEEEQNEGDGDYIFEDIMYDIPDDEGDSSIFEMLEIADLQVHVRNVTSRISEK